MKKLKCSWKKFLALVAGFLGIGSLVSCYGMPIPVDLEDEYFGTVTGDIDGIEQPIPGILVENRYVNVITDENGQYRINSNPLLSLSFTDIDGEENGSFDSKYIRIEDPDNHEINVHLDPKSSGEK